MFLVVLVFAGVVAVISVMLSQRVKAALDSQKDRILRNQYIEFVESIRRQLEDPQLCPDLIGKQAINTGTLDKINTSYGFTKSSPIKAQWMSRIGGVTVQSIELRDMNFVKNIYMANDGEHYQVYRGTVFISPENVRINVTGPGGRTDLMVTLLFMVKNNIIEGCFGETSPGGQCIAMGGGYDWRTAKGGYTYPQYRCHPQQTCRYTSEGTFSAKNEGAANARCPFPYRATSVGTFMDTGDGRWFCQWCNSFYKE